MDVELRHLRAFAAVARSRSFTRAAEQLRITQPALTRTVQQLEAAVQVTLLDRTSRHVELTDAGREFYERAERLLADLDLALASVRSQVIVRLGFSWLLPDPWAQRTVTRFEEATGHHVALLRVDSSLGALDQGAVDVALVRGALPARTALRQVHLFDEARVVICSERSELAARDTVDWSEVAKWPLVVNVVSGTTGPWSWPARDSPEQIIETGNFDEWLESVAADRGIGVVPDVAVRRNIHPAVRYVALTNAPPVPVSLVFRSHVRESLMRRFVEAAVGAAAPIEVS